MNRIIALSTAALLGSSLVAAPVLAQVQTDVAPGGAELKLGTEASGTTNLDTNTTTAAIGPNFDGAISAMGSGSDTARTIGTMAQVGSVNVVQMGGLEGSNAEMMATAEAQNSSGIEELRNSLKANAAVNAALTAQSVDTSDVLAASINADGSLTVYVR